MTGDVSWATLAKGALTMSNLILVLTAAVIQGVAYTVLYILIISL